MRPRRAALTIRSAAPPVTSLRSALPAPPQRGRLAAQRAAARAGAEVDQVDGRGAREQPRERKVMGVAGADHGHAAPGATCRSSSAHSASRAGRQRSARPALARRLRARFALARGPARSRGAGRTRTVCHDCQVMRRITSEITRPMIGSAACRPSATSDRRRDDGEADEAVGAGVIAVGDQRGALQPPAGAQADHRGDLVADEPDRAGDAERQQVVDVLGIDQPVDRLEGGDAGAEEDRRDDEVARRPSPPAPSAA